MMHLRIDFFHRRALKFSQENNGPIGLSVHARRTRLIRTNLRSESFFRTTCGTLEI